MRKHLAGAPSGPLSGGRWKDRELASVSSYDGSNIKLGSEHQVSERPLIVHVSTAVGR
jgi:hypothetical protein